MLQIWQVITLMLVAVTMALALAHALEKTLSELLHEVPEDLSALAWVAVAALYAVLTVATFRMLDIVHDERSPILHLPGSITYACVMGGMAMLSVLALFSAWRSWTHNEPESGDPAVPRAHW